MPESRYAPVRDHIAVPAPAAGADWKITNDHGERLLVVGLLCQLVTAAAVATRTVGLVADAGQYRWFRTTAATGQVAALTRNYVAFPGSVAGADNVEDISLAMPTDGLLLDPGYTLASITDQIQAADQFGSIVLTVYRLTPSYPRNLEPIPGLYGHDMEGTPYGSAV